MEKLKKIIAFIFTNKFMYIFCTILFILGAVTGYDKVQTWLFLIVALLYKILHNLEDNWE